MRVSVHGLGTSLEDAIASAFRERGHEVAEPAEIAIVGVEPGVGADLLELPEGGWEAATGASRDAFFAIQRAARSLVERGAEGRIVVIVPAHALRTSRGCGLAAVSGSFLATAAQVAAVELGPKGIRVNVLAVGPLEGAVPERVAAAVPLGRLARPEDVAAACVLLAAPEAEYLSGALISLDGGYTVTKAAGGSPFAAGA